jgi:hypothetical protein
MQALHRSKQFPAFRRIKNSALGWSDGGGLGMFFLDCLVTVEFYQEPSLENWKDEQIFGRELKSMQKEQEDYTLG